VTTPTARSGPVQHTGYDTIAADFDQAVLEEDRWLKRTNGYHGLVQRIHRSLIPPGQRVLEIGCGRGDLLAALEPSEGIGVDISAGMVAAAASRHPSLRFLNVSGEELDLEMTFDYIVLSDVVPYVHDLQRLMERVAAHSGPRTRVVISTYSNLWRGPLRLMGALGLRPRRPIRNWVAPRDLIDLLAVAGFETVLQRAEILLPVEAGPVSRLANGVLARAPGLRALCLSSWVMARPLPQPRKFSGVSVVVPCRNEAGSIEELARRIPEMGAGTEIVFVEGGSTDDTRQRIEQALAKHPERDLKLVVQTGKGKSNAVWEGFEASHHDVLMILDGDMTVPPEDLPKFYAALASGRGEMVNGNRLVYGMEPGAMRFLNMLGNKAFGWVLSFILAQYVKDTLCGTKVVLREDYERIKAQRSQFEEHDPFGDFDLLLGSALLGLKIVNVPVRYAARIYGDTNIHRFSHGWMLVRLALAGFRRIWLRPVK
jgi:SAM-dependent methyltransferase